MGHSKGSPEKEFYSNIGLPEEEKSQINNVTLHVQELAEQQQTKLRASRRREI